MAAATKHSPMKLSDHIREAAGILATGILRYRRRKVTENRDDAGERLFGLDSFAGSSVNGNSALLKGACPEHSRRESL